ncbi:hypothetical protein [Kitasatospora cheerisanensis]|uniref:Outer membrane channel protein CpnT-like N-terminal domain-containing protein n=1 Tax=Kitasatospora cheerisanensis KCTC 2395 TaxID=1348663 RepID=A0A066YVZ2_9ACTN|nr:hypothetical protein [Kitasatospora cheerisanensis]KDN82110.1 hypothetical protein KCH_61260 [Kitasatospora cheerisanensis KCTC 2395]
MAVELPEPLQWVLLLLAGCRWPEADEDQLRDMADHCRRTADGLKDAAQAGDATIKRALEGQQGVAAEALGKYWEKYSVGKGTQEEPGYLPGAINALNGMGDMLEQMANSAETAKIQIIAQLGILAFELATAEAEAPFTAGASMLEVPAFIAASRATVMATLKTLLKEMLVMAAKQAAQMGAINLLAQGIELAEGHRKSIDMKEVGQNALGGAVGGASAHLIGKGIGKAGEKLGVDAALKTTGGKMATGAAIGVGADVSTQLITTGKVDGESLLGSGLSGGAGAGLHAGASAAKGHFATPKAAEGPKLPGSGDHAGQDGPPTFNKPDSSGGASAYHGPAGSSSGSGSAGGSSGSSHTADAGSSVGAGSHSTASGSGTGESKVSGLTPFGAGRSADSPSVGAQSTGHTATPSHEATPAPAAASHQQAAEHVQESMAPRAETRQAAPTHESVPRQEAAAPTREMATPRTEAQPTAPVHESTPRQESAAPAHETLPRQEATVPAHETLPRQEGAAPAHETLPRQEAAAPAHETLPRQEPAAPDHETLPRQEAAAPAHETLPRQEAAAPHHESTPRQEAAVPAHETLPRQEAAAPAHESIPRQEVAAPVHETVAPRAEQQPAVQPHESVPRQETVAAQPHTVAPAHESVPVAQVHESAPRQEAVPAAHEPVQSQAAAPVHESAPRQEAVNQTVSRESSDVPEAAPQAARPAGAGGMPNLSGVLGGGGTHLDGGTRLSAGPAAPRTVAGPDQVPGQILPDGAGEVPPAANTTQNPMAGGFTPGPVGGAGTHGGAGASGHAGPSATVPRQGRDSHVVADPNRTAQAPAGGTIRPGAGRASESGAGTPPRNHGEATSRPVSEQAHDRLLERQRQQREAELRELGQKSSVRDAVDQLGGRQRPVATRPVDADRLRQDLPGMTPHERAQEIANLTPENRRWLARDPQFVDALKSTLPPHEFARTAAELIVHVDPRAEQAASARQEAQQQVARMLQDPDTAARLMKNGADVVIVPKDVRMTDVPDLHGLAGAHNHSEAGGGRGYDDMRGSGGRHSAVTEENLLGEHTSVGNDRHYQDGYSTTTHEFSHTVHRFGLDANDQKVITDTFTRKSTDPNAPWPDGPLHGANGEKNYSSRDEQEYFAQVTNAYLGTNHGTDPYTGHPRNNGAEWVRKNEPELLPLLEKLYGGKPSEVHDGRANPVHETAAENAKYDGFREFMDHVEGNDTAAAGEHRPPAAEHQPRPSTSPGRGPAAARRHPARGPAVPAAGGQQQYRAGEFGPGEAHPGRRLRAQDRRPEDLRHHRVVPRQLARVPAGPGRSGGLRAGRSVDRRHQRDPEPVPEREAPARRRGVPGDRPGRGATAVGQRGVGEGQPPARPAGRTPRAARPPGDRQGRDAGPARPPGDLRARADQGRQSGQPRPGRPAAGTAGRRAPDPAGRHPADHRRGGRQRPAAGRGRAAQDRREGGRHGLRRPRQAGRGPRTPAGDAEEGPRGPRAGPAGRQRGGRGPAERPAPGGRQPPRRRVGPDQEGRLDAVRPGLPRGVRLLRPRRDEPAAARREGHRADAQERRQAGAGGRQPQPRDRRLHGAQVRDGGGVQGPLDGRGQPPRGLGRVRRLRHGDGPGPAPHLRLLRAEGRGAARRRRA